MIGSHSVAGVISLVSSELPLDTSSSFQEAQAASKLVLDSIVSIDNLEPLAFLDSRGASVSMSDFSDLEKRPSDVSFVRFRYNMNGQAVDGRVISTPDFFFSFCLKLPLHKYDTTSKTAMLVTTPSVSSNSGGTPVARKLFTVNGTTSGYVWWSTPGGSTVTATTPSLF